MGASNAISAYMMYASKVPPLSMSLLAYMALVSKDADESPWYGQGHAALAVGALGRPFPDRADIKAVERAIAHLKGAGAITTERRAGGRLASPQVVRYRLHLDVSASPEKRGKPEPVSVPRKTGEARNELPPKNGTSFPRKVGELPPKSGRASPEKWGSKEKEEKEERVEEEVLDVRTDVTARARARRRAFFGFGTPIGDPTELDPDHDEDVA